MFPVMFRKKESLRKCCIEYISDNVINYTPNNIDHILLTMRLSSKHVYCIASVNENHLFNL